MIHSRWSVLALGLAASLSLPLWAAEQVGVASTRGTIEVNDLSARGTANVSEGASVRTLQMPGQVRLQNGVDLNLSAKSSATIYTDHLQLQQGAVQITGAQNYGVDALGFHVESAAQNVSARIAFDQGRILVTALQSPVKVTKGGELLTQVNAGSTYYFEPDAATAGTPTATPSAALKNITGGLSTGAKWGIVAAAAGAGVGGVVAATHGSSKNSSVSR